jgi:hypothetical protein
MRHFLKSECVQDKILYPNQGYNLTWKNHIWYNLNLKTSKRMSTGSCLTSKLYDKIIKMPSKSHETIPLKISELVTKALFDQRAPLKKRWKIPTERKFVWGFSFNFANSNLFSVRLYQGPGRMLLGIKVENLVTLSLQIMIWYSGYGLSGLKRDRTNVHAK